MERKPGGFIKGRFLVTVISKEIIKEGEDT